MNHIDFNLIGVKDKIPQYLIAIYYIYKLSKLFYTRAVIASISRELHDTDTVKIGTTGCLV